MRRQEGLVQRGDTSPGAVLFYLKPRLGHIPLSVGPAFFLVHVFFVQVPHVFFHQTSPVSTAGVKGPTRALLPIMGIEAAVLCPRLGRGVHHNSAC